MVARHILRSDETPPGIFISYAHADQQADQLPSEIHAALKELLITHHQNGDAWAPHESQVFFDLARLHREPDWSAAIEGALASCGVFVLLLSLKVLRSNFCMNRELATVLRRGDVEVVVVLLHAMDALTWQERKVELLPGQMSRTLGSFFQGGLPRQHGDIEPVSSPKWASRAEAIREVVAGVRDALKMYHRQRHPPPALSHHPMGAGSSDGRRRPGRDLGLLPYFCDQHALKNDYRGIVREWRDQKGWALVVLHRGHEQDQLGKLGNRLRHECLDYELERLEARTGLIWPAPEGSDRQILQACIVELFRALNLLRPPKDQDAAAAQLAQSLRQRGTTPHLYGTLQATDSGAILKEFTEFLERAARQSDSNHAGLLIDLTLTIPKARRHAGIPSLVGRCEPAEWVGRRVWLHQLNPPEALKWDHITKWREDHAEHQLCPDALEAAFQRYMARSESRLPAWLRPWRKPVPELRLGDFAKLVEPLMSQTSRTP